jgi:hypothetical protein
VCIAEGFPSTPFFVDRDLSRSDGIIQCRRMTTAEAIQFGWRVARAIKILIEFLGSA